MNRLLIFWLCLSLPCWGAIAPDATASATSVPQPPTSPALTYSHTVGAGLSNSILVVLCGYYTTPATSAISGITFNSVALTKIQRNNDGTRAATTEAWYLVSPAAGAHNIVVSLTADIGASDPLVCHSRSYSGVNQSSPIDAQSSPPQIVTGSHTAHTVSLTTVAANAWILDIITDGAGTNVQSLAANSPQAHSIVSWDMSVAGQQMGSSDNGPIVTPASTSDGWTFIVTTTASAMTVISLKPAATAPRHRVSQ